MNEIKSVTNLRDRDIHLILGLETRYMRFIRYVKEGQRALTQARVGQFLEILPIFSKLPTRGRFKVMRLTPYLLRNFYSKRGHTDDELVTEHLVGYPQGFGLKHLNLIYSAWLSDVMELCEVKTLSELISTSIFYSDVKKMKGRSRIYCFSATPLALTFSGSIQDFFGGNRPPSDFYMYNKTRINCLDHLFLISVQKYLDYWVPIEDFPELKPRWMDEYYIPCNVIVMGKVLFAP